MNAHTISGSVYAIHADIRTTTLFEGIWPIPDGVTLNSYIVKGDKTALIDLAKDWAGSIAQFESQLASAGTSFEKIDYLVLNHLEPDHTAFLTEIRRRNPAVQILSTPKGIAMVRNFFKITDNLREVKTGDTLDLGGGKVLEFFETPNIHWPETMMTYDRADKILFSCDGFGSYGALGERVFDDEFTAAEHAFYEKEALRYYSNIVASFSVFVKKALEKLGALDVKVVAPSHGIIWRTNPSTIIRRYAAYADYNTGAACEREICVVWGSRESRPRASPSPSTRFRIPTPPSCWPTPSRPADWCWPCRPTNTKCFRRWPISSIFSSASTSPTRGSSGSAVGAGSAGPKRNTTKRSPISNGPASSPTSGRESPRRMISRF